MKIRFISPAKREIRDAFAWYEEQESGLGAAFLSEMDSALARIKQYPESCPIYRDNVRRVLLGRFPYAVWYSIESKGIVVFAVTHLHRRPFYWQNRC